MTIDPVNAVTIDRAARMARCGVDVMEASYERRSVRAYCSRSVDRETVRALIDAAIQALSG